MATIEETSGSATLNNNNKHFGDDGLDKLESHDDALSSHSSAGSSNNVNVDDSGNNSLATDGTNDDAPEIELIIRASTIDGRRKGACIFCQEYFMDLYLLAELKTISLKVTTVDMLKPPGDFRSRFDCTMPPILIDHGEAILENEKIERHIMKSIPGGHNLFVSDKETANVIENIYTKFKLMITRNDAASKTNFLNQLRKINAHMAKRDSRFLTGDALVCFDCELMTRLQHIRVAGKYFCEFEIPEELYHIWRYMYHMYQLDAFTESCPADQDIINQYKLQQRTKMTKHEELEEPTSANTIPELVYKKILAEERERGLLPDDDADEMHAEDDE